MQLNCVVPTGRSGYPNGIAVIPKYQKANGGLPMRRLPDSGWSGRLSNHLPGKLKNSLPYICQIKKLFIMNTENKNSRRDFVKTSAMFTGGIMAAPLLSGANFFSGGDDTIKVALVGCGGRGTGAAMQACLTKQNVKLVAMADAFRDRIDSSYKELTADNASEGSKKISIKNRIDVPEERKYVGFDGYKDRKSTRLNSSHSQISYAVFC